MLLACSLAAAVVGGCFLAAAAIFACLLVVCCLSLSVAVAAAAAADADADAAKNVSYLRSQIQLCKTKCVGISVTRS